MVFLVAFLILKHTYNFDLGAPLKSALMKYIKQLDSLRAIAVLLVIINHWIPEKHIINRIIPTGAIGVDIFFVLSGFLITKILFDNKDYAENFNVSKGGLLKNFYARRTLRIFPIYYLTIFIVLAFHASTDTHIKPAFLYYATYTANFYFYFSNAFDGMLSHLWSLAVEEHFYLIWPWIIIFTKRKYFLPIITSFILIGASSIFILKGARLWGIVTFACFDAFGLGALLAWQLTYGTKPIDKFFKTLTYFAAVATIIFVASLFAPSITYFPFRTVVSVISLWVITYLVLNKQSNKLSFKLIWNNKILIFLGKISYGIYLYHNLVPWINSKIVNIYLNPLLPDFFYKKHWGMLFMVENSILLIIIAWLSFYFIETKFLSLKKYFQLKENKNAIGAEAIVVPELVIHEKLKK
jgi:peptidoglycan/LPS O-acetylase OafA/YrhL